MQVCPKCGGTKHIKNGAIWVRCDCLKEANRLDVLFKSGIGDFLEGGGWESIKAPKHVLKFLTTIYHKSRGILVLHGGTIRTRWKIATLILSDIVMAGKSVYSAKLDTMVEAHFEEEEKEILKRAIHVKAFWLRGDFVRKHSWNGSVFKDLIEKRYQKITLVSAGSKEPFTHPAYKMIALDLERVSWVEEGIPDIS